MTLPSGWRRVRRLGLDRFDVEHDVARELRAHLEMKVDELVALGMPQRQAEEQALGAFGNIDAVRSECVGVRRRRARTRRRSDMLQDLAQDVRFGLRSLRSSPGFAVVAILTLALTIGANAAVFSAVDAVVLRPLPYHDPARLVAVTPKQDASISKLSLERMRARQRAFARLAAYSRWGFTVAGRGEPELLNGAVGTADLFATLGVGAMLGRTFAADEDRPGRDHVVVVSHALWTRRFGSDSAVLGRTITLNGRTRTVIGIMPSGFEFPARGTELWVPTPFDATDRSDYSAGYLLAVGRLRESVTIEQANTDLRRVVATLRQSFPAEYDSTYGQSAEAKPLHEALVGRVRSALLVLFAAVGFVLLIGCANVMNLLLARGAARGRELAVRAALGAGRGRLARQLLAETVLLALLGAALGVALALWGTRVVGAALPEDLLRAGNVSVDGRVLAYTAMVAAVVGIAFGILPAFRSGAAGPFADLRDGVRAGAGVGPRRTMRLLIVGEVALALVLATGTGLVLRSFWLLRAERPGFDAEGVLALAVAAPPAAYSTGARREAFYTQLFDRLAAIPGVISVGAVHLLPFGGSNWNPSILVEGRAMPDGAPDPEVDWRVATPGYFRTVGIPLLRGRTFTAQDDSAAPRIAIINETAARRVFPGEDPLGKRVRTFFEGRNGWATIVGVIGDTKDQSLAAPARPQMYRPFAQHPLSGMAVMVRTTGDPMRVAAAARRTVSAVDPDVPLERVRPLGGIVSESIAEPRIVVVLLGTFGALAVILGGIGIYGVTGYGVAQRTHEIGIRSALGAAPRDVLRLVVGEALALAAAGVALGTAGAFALTGLLRAHLYEVSPTDPRAFVAAAAALVAVALIASWAPASRAMRVDPARVLHDA